ncbi:MAG TPA: hypothetical protein ENO38_05030 [Nitrososphaeria archaeon]|jgi:hypothetical protein|nr:hypothetical protein [Conexivisphaerales archaeon]PMP97129.1 MAG: hypothetical protein C0167_01760 [Nitrososphaera sp.]HEU17013.1 hypothetical protein [Nitrososphaeria archaeon]
MPIDAYVELREGCEDLVTSLQGLGFRLALARRLPGCSTKLSAVGRLRLSEYSEMGPGLRLSEFGVDVDLSEVLLVSLTGLDLRKLKDAMSRHPNVVRAIVVKFSEIRELRRRGSLDLRLLRSLFQLALDRHAPLLMGSGAGHPEELLNPRALYSPLITLAGNFWRMSDYRRVETYLYESAVTRIDGESRL